MLKTPTSYQHELEMVTLESLVPADHLVRKIAKAIDLDFIRERVPQAPGSSTGTFRLCARHGWTRCRLLYGYRLPGARRKGHCRRDGLSATDAPRWLFLQAAICLRPSK